jgi:hypothetical protein
MYNRGVFENKRNHFSNGDFTEGFKIDEYDLGLTSGWRNCIKYIDYPKRNRTNNLFF